LTHWLKKAAATIPINSHVVEIRPHKGGWCCFEGPGVEPFWRGATAKDDALHFAKERPFLFALSSKQRSG
jgi:hypothetical protein